MAEPLAEPGILDRRRAHVRNPPPVAADLGPAPRSHRREPARGARQRAAQTPPQRGDRGGAERGHARAGQPEAPGRAPTPQCRKSWKPAPGRPGRRPSASSFSRWASITRAAAGPQTRPGRRPRRARAAVPRSLAVGERGEQLALALEAVLEVLRDLRPRVGHVGAVAGAEHVGVALEDRPQRVQVGGQRAAVRRDEARAAPRIRSPLKRTRRARSRRGRRRGRGGMTSNGPIRSGGCGRWPWLGAPSPRALVTGADAAPQQGRSASIDTPAE